MKTIKCLSDDECIRLLSHIQHSDPCNTPLTSVPRNVLAFALMLDAGLRIGETCRLLFSDLIIGDAPVSNLFVRPELAKRQQSRLIPVSQFLHNSITRHYEQNKLLPGFLLSSYVFPGRTPGGHIATRSISLMLKSKSLVCLGRSVNPHMLRHTFATRLMRVSSIRVVQLLLGHKCLTSTQIYTHPNNVDMRQAIDSVQLNLKSTPPPFVVGAL